MFKDRLDYIRQLFAPETDALRRARESGGPNEKISLNPEEGRLLQVLMRLAGVKTVVEIGTLGGYSALWMAGALADGGHIHTIEKDAGRAATARSNIAGHPAITLHEGDARQVLKTLSGPFDMVFIDADKLHYADYLDWAEQNVRKGGLIAGDNTLLFDAAWNDAEIERVRPAAREAMRAFNKRLADPAKYTSILLPTEEGMTIAIKEF